MRTFGTLKLIERDDEQFWEITTEPHVMIKLKSVLTRIATHQFKTVFIKNSPEVCRDLEWFTSRYPLECSDLAELQCGADIYRDSLAALEEIRRPDYKPRQFNLALPAREYQSLAAEIYLKKGGQLLADALGLGKSVTSIAALTDPQTLPALIVCESHLPHQWVNYVSKFLPSATTHIIKQNQQYDLPPADIYIITYHKLAAWAEILTGMIHSIVFDEIQALRHEESKKYGAAMAIRRGANFCQGLSATPIMNYGGEIFNIVEIIFPGQLGTRMEFEREWCSGAGKHSLLNDPEAFGSYLRDQSIMLRRTRKDVGRELPAVQTIIETIEYSENDLRVLETGATELAHRILSAETSFHEKGEAARDFDLKLRQATGIAKAPFAAAFARMLVENEGEKVVLTAWHRGVHDIFFDHLSDLGISFYTGEETTKGKIKSVEKFIHGDDKILVLSLRSGAGLDGLQEVCSTIIHAELDWSPGVMQQCTGRLHRDGQKNPVMEYFLLSDGGSDPIISEILGIKKSQAAGILEIGGSSGLEKMQSEGSRVKKMAELYLKRKREK